MNEGEALTPQPVKKGLLRRAAPIVVAGLLLVGMAGGGVAGSAATVFWMTSIRPAASAPAPVVKTSMPREVAVGTAATPENNLTAIYNALSPAVVSVAATTGSSRSVVPQGESGGTGFIVDDQGNILTNNHVVQGASKVSITLIGGTKIDAKVVGTDPGSDLALLKADIPSNKIAVAPLGDPDQVQPGETAIAIGSPFGLDNSITAGIISAINREFGTAGGRPMRGLIQTDAPINPGNSGGPLINAKGEVIGITTSIESPIRGSVGLGFAIPINRAKGLLPQLQTGQTVQHTYLGIKGGAITPDLVQAHKLPVDTGVWVAEVVAGGPADNAGLKGSDPNNSDTPVSGDIITKVDGKAVKDVPELSGYLDTKKVGDTVTLTVLRDGKTIEVKVTLGAWPAEDQG